MPDRRGAGAEDALARISVSAGDLAREHSIVSFDYAVGKGQEWALRDARGALQPLQVAPDGKATFILRALAAGETASFDVIPQQPRADSTVLAESAALADHTALTERIGSVVRLRVAGRSVVDFQLGTEAPNGVDPSCTRGGYLHPLRTPNGVRVTDDYPGDHPHHHGIFAAWTRARCGGREVDFWNVQARQGKVELKGVEQRWSGPVHAGLTAHLEHVSLGSLAPSVALREQWTLRVYQTHPGAAPYFVFDLESIQCAPSAPLELLEYHYGGFALRGHEAWRDPENVVVITSEGRGRADGDGSEARWCFMGGKVAGSVAGYVALGHPANFRAPQKLRIHPTDPFVAFAPVRDGAFAIEPGAPYVTRFRFVTLDGAFDAASFERLWCDYATPPLVTLDA